MRNKAIWIGALIGGAYALIFYLIFRDIGDAGSLLWLFPPAWPLILTAWVSGIIVFLSSMLINFKPSNDLINITNIVLWIFIGAIIGYLIKKGVGRNKSIKGFLIGAVAVSIIGFITTISLQILLRIFGLFHYFLEIPDIHSLPGKIFIFMIVGGLIGLWMYGNKYFWLYIVIGTVLGAINIFLFLPVLIYIYLMKLQKQIKDKKNNKTHNLRNLKLIFVFILIFFLGVINLNIVDAAVWKYGSTHQHTGYSTNLGPDGIPFGGDGCSVFLEGHLGSFFNGYTVAELARQAENIDLSYLGFSDHSYCIDSGEFNTVKSDCNTEDVNRAGFTCLMGEEVSAAEIVGDKMIEKEVKEDEK